MSKATILAVLLCLAGAAGAQQAPPDLKADAQVAAIDRIGWLVGEWEGTATMRRGPQEPDRLLSWERIQRAAGGTALLVQGRHYQRLPDGARGPVVHDSAAMITFDPRTGRYRVTSQLADGRYGSFDGVAEGEVRNATFVWRIPAPQGVARYRIERMPDGRWFEQGAFCPAAETADSQCRGFFEMTLTRKGE